MRLDVGQLLNLPGSGADSMASINQERLRSLLSSGSRRKQQKRQGMGMPRLMVATDLLTVWRIHDDWSGSDVGSHAFVDRLVYRIACYRGWAAKAWHPRESMAPG
jgi:hypothetical protein